MHKEMANGDKPELTSLVGASAAPSHTPAPSPQKTPKPCRDPNCGDVGDWVTVLMYVMLMARAEPVA